MLLKGDSTHRRFSPRFSWRPFVASMARLGKRATGRAKRRHRQGVDRRLNAAVRLDSERRSGRRRGHLHSQAPAGNAAPAVSAGDVHKARQAFVERSD
jgi:hypothetical protein